MALARERNTEEFGDSVRTLTLTVAAGVTIYKGALVCLDATGKAIPGTTLAGGAVYAAGKALHTATAGEDVQVSCGVRKYLNSSSGDAITDAEVGLPFYVVDDETVAKTSNTGARLAGGFIVQVDSDGVRCLISPAASKMAQAAALADAGISIQKRTVTVAHGDLTDADTSMTFSIGAALPANARIIGVSIHTVTAFAGGSVSDMVIDIGTADDIDAIIDGADVVGSIVDGQAISRPLGISPNKLFATAGAQLIATFVSTGDNLVNLTAGTCTIDVLFAVLA